MTKDELLDLWEKDRDLAARGIVYLLHVGTNQIADYDRDQYRTLLKMAVASGTAKIRDMDREVQVFDFAKALSEQEPVVLLDCMAVASGWASVADVRPEPSMQLKPEFADLDKVREVLADK